MIVHIENQKVVCKLVGFNKYRVHGRYIKKELEILLHQALAERLKVKFRRDDEEKCRQAYIVTIAPSWSRADGVRLDFNLLFAHP